MLVRSWNVFHGNTRPPGRQGYLRRMVELASGDEPDVLVLQELPVWALPHLARWSGMQAFGDVAARPSLGPIPWTANLGRMVTDVNNGLFRSALTGQANAILLSPEARVLWRRRTVLNGRGFRKAQARWLRLDAIARLAWAFERRICHAVRADLDGRTIVVAGLHATSYRPDRRLADAELLRAAAFVDSLAEPDDVVVLAGDFNVNAGESRTLADLAGEEWGFSLPGPGIDHVLVRGADAGEVHVWPEERRVIDSLVVSDHAPVELEIA